MKKIVAIIILSLISVLVFASCGQNKADEDYAYASGTDIKNHENELVAELLKTEEDIQYYAYLNLDSAEEEIKPVILTARNLIIHRHDYVVDGKAEIIDENGNVIREIPQFYDLFPEDWDVPGTYELP